MNELPLTAEDLALYALSLLEGEENARVETLLRASTEARKELANIRGDLALFALATDQHTPPTLTRQRLMKQVARERRSMPIEVPVQELAGAPATQTFAPDLPSPAPITTPVPPQQALPPQQTLPPLPPVQRTSQTDRQALKRNAGMAVPRVVSQPEPEAFLPEVPAPPPEPQVFPRDPQVSASAHSVTMFEQHFASDAVARIPEPPLPPDPQAYSRRAPKKEATAAPPAIAIDAVEDRFTPSGDGELTFSAFHETRAAQPSAFSRFFVWAGWAVAATVAAATAFVVRDDFGVREELTSQQAALTQATMNAARAETIMQTLQSPSSQRFVLARQDAAPAPSARVAYLPERGTLVFQASNLETLQPYKTYELWLIPKGEGHQPIPAGTFKPDARGYASVVLPQLPRGTVAQNFGVTIEDDPGSSSPTLPILLVGQQS